MTEGKLIPLDVVAAFKSFEQIEKMCADILLRDFPEKQDDGCQDCPFCRICRDFLGDKTLTELMSEYSSEVFPLYVQEVQK